MAFRFACQQITWGFGIYCDTRKMLREMKQAGYEAVEFLVASPTIEDLAEVRKLLYKEGMEAIGVSSFSANLWRRNIHMAAAFGSRLCMDYPGMSRKDVRGLPATDWQIQMGAEQYDQVAEYGLEYGITVALHNHLGFSTESAEEMHDLMRRTKYLTACVDTGHFAGAGSDPIEVIRKWPNRIGHVHLKDWKGPRHDPALGLKDYRFVELGEGIVDVKGVMKALEDIGYNGWIVVEQDFTEKTPFESALQSREYLRSLGY